MGEKTVFKPFKVTTNRRYWEDEDSGILVRKGRDFTIYPKHLRSYMLKFAIVRGDVKLLEGEKVIYAFKGRIMSIVGGADKNLITIIGENGKKVNRKLEVKSALDKAKENRTKNESDVIVVKEESPVKKEEKVVIVDDIPEEFPKEDKSSSKKK